MFASVIVTIIMRQTCTRSRSDPAVPGSSKWDTRASMSRRRRANSSGADPSSQPRRMALSIIAKPPWRDWGSDSQSKGSRLGGVIVLGSPLVAALIIDRMPRVLPNNEGR
jgi:hypothetical protein